MAIVPSDHATISALLKGAEMYLRAAARFNDEPDAGLSKGKRIGVTLAPGMPPTFAGQWFAALHWAGGQGADKNPVRHDVFHGLVVTLTGRIGYAPKDRHGIALTSPNDLYDLIDAFAAPKLIHGSWGLLAEANKYIPGTAEHLIANGGDENDATTNGFVETLALAGFGPEREADAGWIAGNDGKGVWVCDIRFEMARRLQSQE